MPGRGQRRGRELVAHAPLGVLCALRISLGVAQALQGGSHLGDLVLCAVLDEDGLAAPLDGDALPRLHCLQVHLQVGQGEDISRGRQRGQRAHDGDADGRGVQEASTTQHEVGEGALLGVVTRCLASSVEVGVGAAVVCTKLLHHLIRRSRGHGGCTGGQKMLSEARSGVGGVRPRRDAALPCTNAGVA